MPSKAGDFYLPTIFGFDTLFGDPKATSPGRGFPHGGTVVLGGHPGAGQSVFALSLVRDLLLQNKHNSRFYYINTISGLDDLKRRYHQCGWFGEDDTLWGRTHVIEVAEINLPGPARNADELINPVFTQIRDVERVTANDLIFVIVDTLSDLVKDSQSDGDRRRNVHELIARLKSGFPNGRLALTILVSDWVESSPIGSAVEEHLADFVFRFAVQPTGFQRRRRIVEISKSEGASPLLGTHTWELINCQDIRRKIAPSSLKNSILAQIKKYGSTSENWGTIAIFPRPNLFPIGLLQGWKGLPHEAKQRHYREATITTGTPGLDEMIVGDRKYWARRTILNESPRLSGSLYMGSTSIILGKSGTGKTLTAIQFLLADPKRGLYINFENRPSRVANMFPTANAQKLLKHCATLYRRRANLDFNTLLAEIRHIILNSKDIERIAIDGLTDLFVVSDKREFAQLIEDLLVTIRQTSLQKIHESRQDNKNQSKSQALLRPITIVVTLEMDIGSDVFPMLDSISFTADNLIVLRHIMINDELRKTVQVLKARGHSPDKQVRELLVKDGNSIPVRVAKGLENYSGLNTSNPQPVAVTVQLIAENSKELLLNEELVATLRRLFKYPVDSLGFSRHEIHRTLLDIAAGGARTPHSNVKIMSIDEWWIRELRSAQRQGSDAEIDEHPLLGLESFLLAPGTRPSMDPEVYESINSDFWINEFEKVTSPDVKRRSFADTSETDECELDAEMVACPSHMDFGAFCINTHIADSLGMGDEFQHWPDVVSAVPRVWVERENNWFRDPTEGASTLVDMLHKAVGKQKKGLQGFSFDMETSSTAACAFLEFCWAFGASENFLIRDVVKYTTSTETERERLTESHPMTTAFSFLSFLVVNGLMKARTSAHDAQASLFSRHWFSTVMELESTVSVGPNNSPMLLPIPFFPVGSVNDGNAMGSQALCFAVHDALNRFSRLLSRVHAAVEYRDGLVGNRSHFGSIAQWETRIAEVLTNAQRCIDINKALTASDIEFALSELENIASGVRAAAVSSGMFPSGVGIRKKKLSAKWRPKRARDRPSKSGFWRRLPAAIAMDLRDVLQLLTWNDLRVRLIRGELASEALAESLTGNRSKQQVGSVSSLTGYTCEGSWMVGVGRSTCSPELAAKFIEEITSASSTLRRAELGAGIPARKDFYDFHGNTTTPLFPSGKVSWNQLLEYTVARARRRERVVCYELQLALVMDVMNQKLHDVLATAAALQSQYVTATKKDVAINMMQTKAKNAAEEILSYVMSQMRSSTVSLPCLLCRHPEQCQKIVNAGGRDE
ncbi:MAG: AAA family ATPase [Rhodopirellula sp.]|nr:AAA family ATPase [Rhodopirellula sp.]